MTPVPGAPGSASADQRDPRTYLRILWRWKVLLLAFVVAVPVGAALLRTPAAPYYTASTLLEVQPVEIDTSLFTQQIPSSPDQNLLRAARLVRTAVVAQGAARRLPDPPGDPRVLLGMIRVEPDTAAGFLTITARADRPDDAVRVANAFGASVVSERAATAIGDLNRTIRRIGSQIDTLDPDDRTGRTQLSEQLQRLRALRAAQGSNAQVIEPAMAPAAEITTSGTRTIVLALVAGVLLGLGAVVVAESSDRRIRTPAGLEEMTGLPLLAAVPPSAFSVGGGVRERDEEAFQMLRGALTYFNVDRRLRSVVVASPGQKDGKTTVATRLAVALARTGKRVVLLDSDLRRPQVCARLGIEETAGLGAVLVGEATLADVLVEVGVRGARGGRLTVLPAGPPPPNPSELLSSQGMARLLARLEEQADLVIVDTPAALAVSDALPLIQSASGVVLIARMNHSSRDAVRRLQRVIATAQGTVLGVVATGAGGARAGYEPYRADPPARGRREADDERVPEPDRVVVS